MTNKNILMNDKLKNAVFDVKARQFYTLNLYEYKDKPTPIISYLNGFKTAKCFYENCIFECYIKNYPINCIYSPLDFTKTFIEIPIIKDKIQVIKPIQTKMKL